MDPVAHCFETNQREWDGLTLIHLRGSRCYPLMFSLKAIKAD